MEVLVEVDGQDVAFRPVDGLLDCRSPTGGFALDFSGACSGARRRLQLLVSAWTMEWRYDEVIA
jgi:hypothetical protein